MPGHAEQQDILTADLAALTDADIPPDEADRAVPDPDTGRPAALAGLSAAELEELIAAGPVRVAGPIPAGCLPRDGTGGGAGFADGGALDVLVPGVPLAGFADDAQARLSAVSDDELIGVLRAWWRQTSWAQVRALAAIAELARRRPADRTPAALPGQFPARLSEFLPDEVAMALTLTKCAAETQVELALGLAGRPATAAALEAGRIDLRKALVILDAVAPLSDEHAAAVEASVLPAAAGQTTGELRRSVTAAVLALDPDAVRRRREEAEKGARVECYPDPDGTATLTGRSLPPAEVLAADKRLCQVARYWKKLIRAAWKHADPHGELPRPEHGMDLLRAKAYLALLLGQPLDTPPAALLPPAQHAPAPDSPDGSSPDGPTAPDGATAADGATAPDGKTAPDGNADPDGMAAPDGRAGPDGPTAPDGKVGSDGKTAPDGKTGPDSPAGGDCQPVPESQDLPAGLRRPDPVAGLPPMAGLISLTLPLTTLLDLSDQPGEAAGYGPLHADTARLLACALAGHRATRWQVILTGPDGHALAAGTARGSPGTRGSGSPGGGGSPGPPGSGSPGGGGWTVQVTAEPIATGHCDHRNQEAGHDPSPALQRLVRARTATCTSPGCRRPAASCDLDHTLAYDNGGITCECGIGPGCRRCHRRKQALQWKLEQPAPGVMTWTTPAGRRYTTHPSKHPT